MPVQPGGQAQTTLLPPSSERALLHSLNRSTEIGPGGMEALARLAPPGSGVSQHPCLLPESSHWAGVERPGSEAEGVPAVHLRIDGRGIGSCHACATREQPGRRLFAATWLRQTYLVHLCSFLDKSSDRYIGAVF